MIRYHRLDRSTLQVSERVFVGGMPVLADDDTRRRAIRRARDAGIDWIDTAPRYAQGRSQQAIAAAAANELPPDAVARLAPVYESGFEL